MACVRCITLPLGTTLTDLNRYQQQNPDASPYDLVWLKRFVKAMALGIDGVDCVPEACKETVHKYWNNFTAAWQRQNPGILRDVARSVTQVCILCTASFRLRGTKPFPVYQRPSSRRDKSGQFKTTKTICHQSSLAPPSKPALCGRLVRIQITSNEVG
jgi:hypothetical protein